MDRREPGVEVPYWIRCDECVGIMAPDPHMPLIESS
jgi:hypothetical protein